MKHFNSLSRSLKTEKSVKLWKIRLNYGKQHLILNFDFVFKLNFIANKFVMYSVMLLNFRNLSITLKKFL